MTYFSDFLIDGAPILAPDAGLSVQLTDLDSPDTGRDESGVMHRLVVRRRVHSWELNYTQLTEGEYRYMESLFAGKTAFTLTYRDPGGERAQCTAYCSGSSVAWADAVTGRCCGYKLHIAEC